jgi:hypothetical protein
MADTSRAQQWLLANSENPSIKFLVDWITRDLQRTLESVANIEIVPDNPDHPSEVEFVIDFSDGTVEKLTAEVEED